MTIDLGTIQITVIIVTNLVLIIGAYYKLRMDICKRPLYQKVEDMIKRDAISEQRIEDIIKRDAFSNTGGQLLELKIDSLKDDISHLDEKIDKYFQPKSEVKK